MAIGAKALRYQVLEEQRMALGKTVRFPTDSMAFHRMGGWIFRESASKIFRRCK
jgi:hypothetical protein